MAHPFNFESWLDTVGFASEEARRSTEAILRTSEFINRESLVCFNVDVHAPADIPPGRKAVLQNAIKKLQAEAGILSSKISLFWSSCSRYVKFLTLPPKVNASLSRFMSALWCARLIHPWCHSIISTFQLPLLFAILIITILHFCRSVS